MPAVIFLHDFNKISTKVGKCGKVICYAFFLCIGKTSYSLIIRTFDDNMHITWGYLSQVELVHNGSAGQKFSAVSIFSFDVFTRVLQPFQLCFSYQANGKEIMCSWTQYRESGRRFKSDKPIVSLCERCFKNYHTGTVTNKVTIFVCSLFHDFVIVD